MRISRRKKSVVFEGDLTPMIDMAFQLIAFFMVLINFSQVERTDEILLPDSALAKPPDTPPDYQVVLNLTDQGQVIMSGYLIEKISQMRPYLEQVVDDAGRQSIPPDQISVIIRSHKDVQMGKVQELIKKCQDSQLESFTFRVKERVRQIDYSGGS